MRKLLHCLALVSAFTPLASQAFETNAQFAILVEADTNTVLFDKSADHPMVPSSMTKLMTLYILFDQIKQGKVKMDDTFSVSEKAWRTGGSKTFIHVGDKVRVEDLIRGIAIQSGNDATVAVAENLASSEEAFASLMNQAAQKLGMQHSHFTNASGLPEDSHYSSAHDLAILADHLIHDFPDYYHYFSEKEFTYNNITQGNRNLLLGEMAGVDGLKTGHTEEAGYGMVVSAEQNGRRLIAVINGLKSTKERAEEAKRILAYGFADFKTVTLVKAGEVLGEAPVWFGATDSATLTAKEDIAVTLPVTNSGDVEKKLHYMSPLTAPLNAGEEYAELILKLPNGTTQKAPVTVASPIEKAGFFRHIWLAIKYYVGGRN